ncbi:hypothetical protein ABFS82_10G062400 [Erythranthe guttata]|uniref:LRAT domain-containing protein n=1 Tax=Erythranthe guttata TaxID=4155 RepID=A0A022PP98_ERYGU|nr:PREDICTED: uncharacterized protein LOC105949939 [Erythranthe guttata]EYU18127.1 hypothetical protein MIMGU_mgv1a013412mg [Erythranthe guttata]|eukprot:XP_012828699.1 PREDICTED: uncharacterized protein LOC105949939 [Erythranthe guttata]
MGLLSHRNRIKRSSLEVGDHIYAWRIAYIYSHHGIYIGDDTVIHFTTHGVISSSVDEFLSFWEVGRSKLRRYKYSSKCSSVVLKPRGTCTTAASDDGATVVHRAKKLLEHGFGSYDLGKRNCENFAVYCKTGLRVANGGSGEDIAGLSAQVASFTCKAVVGTAVGVPLILLAAIAATAGTEGIVVISVLASYAVIFGGVVYYCIRRCDKDIGMRDDVYVAY